MLKYPRHRQGLEQDTQPPTTSLFFILLHREFYRKGFQSRHVEENMASISEEELLYYKGLRILNKAIAPELRQLFKTLWERKKSNPWQDDQTSGESFFNDHKPKSENGRYDNTIKTGNVEAWDMTVLCRAFIDYTLMRTINNKYSDKVSILRNLRNKYAHNTSLSLSRDDYEEHVRQIKTVFNDLGLKEDTLTLAINIKPDDIERQELLNEIKTLRERKEEILNTLSKSDQEILREMQSLRQEQTEGKEELLNKLTSFRRELTDELHTLTQENLTNRTVSRQEATGGEGKPDQEDLPEWFQGESHDRQQLIVSDKLIGSIATHVGAEWELIAAEMKISKISREGIIAKNPRSISLQVVAAFTMWKQKNSRKATIASLMRILWTCNERCTIGWEGIEAEVMKWDW
ncbi:uncharacterized protein LOC124255751 isoform X2 [Haliotis rubra]|uniref:uncharacterized protein LOC124255751 isoform X2 n=1 Tax=Haliotis rubra TaxID=36100 RepID=UPI001EE57C20|nr:uncharacterized protein LOC124255751 isoform X2 [Haliotis rubra]